MKTGREVILNYCNKILNLVDLDHLHACKEVKHGVEGGHIDFLIEQRHCPDDYGLENFVGDCEFEEIKSNYKKRLEQCKKCWNRALIVIE
jgi:hypothetical protein